MFCVPRILRKSRALDLTPVWSFIVLLQTDDERDRGVKGRQSGMPDEDCWASFFDAGTLVDMLISSRIDQGDVAEFGSGYGTFTVPTAKVISGVLHGFDIEAELVALVDEKCNRLGLRNVRLETRDFSENGTGLPDESVAHVMIYNLLHIEHPAELLKEALRILEPGGMASVIHWRRDIPTPRGPAMEIRPSPGECQAWAEAAGFMQHERIDISTCCPYHFGLLLIKP